ncbi:hypothetical protein NJ7G_3175 [Natrinema sp. J7-2]|nr:hypothetical protein NJ7G_3175 [Natrinema sp. J7-2]
MRATQVGYSSRSNRRRGRSRNAAALAFLPSQVQPLPAGSW